MGFVFIPDKRFWQGSGEMKNGIRLDLTYSIKTKINSPEIIRVTAKSGM